MARLNRLLELGLVSLVILLTSGFETARASKLPRRVQASAEVYIKENKNNDLTKLNGRWLSVTEYVDLDAGKSSIMVSDAFDFTRKRPSYFFNQPGTGGGRKFLGYSTEENSCWVTDLRNWPLADLRLLLIEQIPFDDLNEEMVDIALGPVGLLVALPAISSRLTYAETRFSQDRLTLVDVWEHVATSFSSQFEMTLFQVTSISKKVISNKNDKYTPAEPPEAGDVVAARVCHLTREEVKKNRVDGKAFYCAHADIDFEIDYHIVSEMIEGSLMGQSLAELGEFDFDRDPFMQPVGIGCWSDKLGTEVQKRLRVPNLDNSACFSGQLSNMMNEKVYVAADSGRASFRLDRDGRSSVYLATQGVTYYANQFVSSLDEETKNNPSHDDHHHRRPPSSQRCVQIRRRDESVSAESLLDRLLGIGEQGQAYHLGTRMIQHVIYEIYERELVAGDQGNIRRRLPLLLDAPLGAELENDPDYRLFVTYYVIERPPKAIGQRPVQTIQMMEAWLFHKGLKERQLVNLVEFDQFSWSLDVTPMNSRQESSRHPEDVFVLEPCLDPRAGHFRLELLLEQEIFGEEKSMNGKKYLKALKARHRELERSLTDAISKLAISHPYLRLHKLKTSFVGHQDRTDVRVAADIVDLQQWDLVTKQLENVDLEKASSSIRPVGWLAEIGNVHTMSGCQAESVLTNPNSRSLLVFCENLRSCLIAPESSEDSLLRDAKIDSKPGSNNGIEVCEVVRIQATPKFVSRTRKDQLEKIMRVRLEKFVFQFQLSHILTYNAKASKTSIYQRELFASDSDESQTLVLDNLVGARYVTSGSTGWVSNHEVGSDLGDNIDSTKVASRCRAACRLDERCLSYSICQQSKMLPSCQLTGLRLTRDRLQKMRSQMSPSNNQESSSRLSIEIEIGDSSVSKPIIVNQIFQFVLDSACSIRPKDLLASYSSQSMIYTGGRKEHEDKGEINYEDGCLASQVQPVSLDECAGFTYEHCSPRHLSHTPFVYCTLSSACFINDKNLRDLPDLEICHPYQRYYLQFYERSIQTRLGIRQLDEESTTGASAVSSTTGLEGEITKDSLELMRTLKLGRQLLGLSQEDCSRDCSLPESGCFAFDVCRSQKGILCTIYMFKSPLETGSDSNVIMTANAGRLEAFTIQETAMDCNHFYLKPPYSEAREKINRAQGGTSNHESNLDADQAHSDQLAEEAIEKQHSRNNKTPKSGKMPNFILFILGFALGMLLIFYGRSAINSGQRLIELARSKWDTYQTHDRRRTSGLAFVAQLDLSHIERPI